MTAFLIAFAGTIAAIALAVVFFLWFFFCYLPRQPVDRDEDPIEAEWRVESIRASLQDEDVPSRMRSGGAL